ncbi:MAG: hydantoinase/oxoprolinase family protein [Gammaproteobacteria bacterium]
MKIINVDNGGTLTDFCLMDGADVHHVKVLTTPYDLSECFFDGISKVSEQVYGSADAARLLRETDYVRYSTTQGTNAIVERRGPRLGLITDERGAEVARTAAAGAADLLGAMVGERIAVIDPAAAEEDGGSAVVRAITEIGSLGAQRIVVALTGTDFETRERAIFRVAQRHFPSHLLGAVPIVTASGLADEPDPAVRAWTALFNAYLHPAMETFLYHTDHRLKEQKCTNPLLIFRNDGGTARVAKTTALKTYSSGPRAGMEAVRALCRLYGLGHTVSYDVGGTTTDIGVVDAGDIVTRERGSVEGIEIALPLAELASAGVGGSSIISVEDGALKVGPQSVGAAPGPACFGFGGQEVTVTDAAFVAGILSPETYFGGQLNIDVDKARDAIERRIANELGIDVDSAALQVIDAWSARLGQAITDFARPDPSTSFVAFGGAGALVATSLASAVGVKRVIIPRLASVFSACGIGFSDLSHEYRQRLPADGVERQALVDNLLDRARRDMFAEGVELDDCEILWQVASGGSAPAVVDVASFTLPAGVSADDAVLQLKVVKHVQHLSFTPVGGEREHAATSTQQRELLGRDGGRESVPVYRLEDLEPGASASGPAIVEEAYFTGRVDAGWRFRISANGDVVLTQE